MVTTTLTSSTELPQQKIQFRDIHELREELEKQSRNEERLREFQKTIDEALLEGDRRGVIEFTEGEWNDLITNENLPPLETVKKLLKEKIDGMEIVKETSRESREGILGELKHRAEEKVQAVKEMAGEKVEYWKEKAEKLKRLSKPALWFAGIGLSFKLWGYKAMNWFSGLFGDQDKYAKDIEKIEMEKEFLHDPEAAMKKYGKEALGEVQNTEDKEHNKQTGAEEKEGEILEKIPGGVGLTALGVSLFAILKKALPASMVKNIDEKNGVSILRFARKWPILKYLGVGGLALWGASSLYAHMEEHPEAAKSLGEMPTDSEGKRAWIEKAGALTGIGGVGLSAVSRTFSEGTDFIKNGFEVSGDRPPAEPGNLYLDEHPLFKKPVDAMLGVAEKLLKMYKKNPALYNTAIVGLAFAFPGIRNIAISSVKNSAELAIQLVKTSAGAMVKHPFLSGAGAMVGIAGLGLATHIQLRENTTYEEMLGFVGDALHVEEVGAIVSDIVPDSIEDKVKYMTDVIYRQTEKVVDFCDHIFDNCQDAVKEFFKLDQDEKICSMSKTGLEAFQSEFSLERTGDSLGSLVNIENLCGIDKKSGIIAELLRKVQSGETLSEGDIYHLMQATKGTRIRIFPEGGDKATGRFIQFVVLDDEDRVTSLPKNICPNPALSKTTQENLYRDFLYDPTDNNGLEKGISRTGKGLRLLASEIAEGANKEGAWNKFFAIGGSILSFGGKAFLTLGKDLVQIPVDTVFSTGNLNLQTQEGWCEFGGDMMPIVAIGAIAKGTSLVVPKILRTTLHSVTVKPLKAGIKMGIKHIIDSINFSLIERDFGQTRLDFLKRDLASAQSHYQKKRLQRQINRMERKEMLKGDKKAGIHKLTPEDLLSKQREMTGERARMVEEKRALQQAGKDVSKIDKQLAKNKGALDELGKIAQNLEAKRLGRELPHPKINMRAIEGIKIRGKGIAALVGLIGGAYVIDKAIDAIKGPDSGSYRDKSAQEVLDESMPEEDGIDYFGYEEVSEGEEDPENSETHCETLRDFEEHESRMEQEYLSDFNDLFEKFNQKNATLEDINKVCEAHEKRVQFMQRLLGNNKTLLLEFWQKKFPQDGSIDNILPEELGQQGVKAFMAIFRRDGQFQLECMNKQDMKNILVKMKESSETSTTETLLDGGVRILPVVGSLMSGVDAVKDFSNGDIKSGLWNTGWCVGGLVLDFFTAGTVSTGIRAAKVATNVVVHTGIMLSAQGIQQYFDDARSEVINIASLPGLSPG